MEVLHNWNTSINKFYLARQSKNCKLVLSASNGPTKENDLRKCGKKEAKAKLREAKQILSNVSQISHAATLMFVFYNSSCFAFTPSFTLSHRGFNKPIRIGFVKARQTNFKKCCMVEKDKQVSGV